MRAREYIEQLQLLDDDKNEIYGSYNNFLMEAYVKRRDSLYKALVEARAKMGGDQFDLCLKKITEKTQEEYGALIGFEAAKDDVLPYPIK
jgi:hypothetical protein